MLKDETGRKKKK